MTIDAQRKAEYYHDLGDIIHECVGRLATRHIRTSEILTDDEAERFYELMGFLQRTKKELRREEAYAMMADE